MNVRNYAGAVLCAAIFIGSFALSEGALHFFNALGLAIVLSGTVGATLLSYPWPGLQSALIVGKNAWTRSPPSPEQVVDALTRFSVDSRCDGILALERHESRTTVSFLRTGIEMMVDGYDAAEIREILSAELAYFVRRRQLHERVFRHMARLAPAFGVAGSVIGLMSMLFGIGETTVILRTIPLALTSTLYGIVLSNFVLSPVAEAIAYKTSREALVKRLVIDGVQAILEERNPHRLEKRLEAFLTPSDRSGGRTLEEMRRRFEERRVAREPVSSA